MGHSLGPTQLDWWSFYACVLRRIGAGEGDVLSALHWRKVSAHSVSICVGGDRARFLGLAPCSAASVGACPSGMILMCRQRRNYRGFSRFLRKSSIHCILLLALQAQIFETTPENGRNMVYEAFNTSKQDTRRGFGCIVLPETEVMASKFRAEEVAALFEVETFAPKDLLPVQSGGVAQTWAASDGFATVCVCDGLHVQDSGWVGCWMCSHRYDVSGHSSTPGRRFLTSCKEGATTQKCLQFSTFVWFSITGGFCSYLFFSCFIFDLNLWLFFILLISFPFFFLLFFDVRSNERNIK